MTDIHGVMNNTKWDELRLAMYAIKPTPRYRCMMINGHYSREDAEWFYHFRYSETDPLCPIPEAGHLL
jgi:hypothetical protein